MKVVYKYTIQPIAAITLPVGAEILSVGVQENEVRMWAKVDPDAPTEERTFMGFGTGHEIPDGLDLEFIGTAIWPTGTLVFHIFEQKN